MADEAQVKTQSVIDEIMEKSRYSKEDEYYLVAKQGVTEFISHLAQVEKPEEKVNKFELDEMIAHIDQMLSSQVDRILHHPKYQKLESSWRGLQALVNRTDFSQNIKIELLNVSKEEIMEDFNNTPDITQTTIYQNIYSNEYGQFGGEPVGAIIGDYEFGSSTLDIELLKKMSSVAAMSHAPFISSVGANFFGLDDYTQLPSLQDISGLLDGPQYMKWRSLRESDDSKYLGLLTSRFLARSPYHPENNPVKTFNYREDVGGSHSDMLWSNSAYLFASRITDSFANFRWCGNIIGPKGGGEVTDLPMHFFENFGSMQSKIPTEVLITDRREFELAEHGFISLTHRRGTSNAVFFSANSVLRPRSFPDTEEGKEAEMNFKLGTQLPYLFLISRLAHYLKILQREEIGSWKDRQETEKGLNEWLRQYVSNQENPPADVRSKKPFKSARVVVEDIPGEPGFYKVEFLAQPHFKYMGASFELSLVGKLDKE